MEMLFILSKEEKLFLVFFLFEMEKMVVSRVRVMIMFLRLGVFVLVNVLYLGVSSN